MAVDWAADVRKYAPAADEGIIAGVVRYCGIALTKRDSALVSFSDPKELDRVRNGFMKKKLALTDSDDVLNAALAKVGERMKADRTKNRVTVYYLLAEAFGKLDMFQKKAVAAKAPAKSAAKPVPKATPKVSAAAPAKAATAKAATAKTAAKPAAKTAAAPAAKATAKPAAKVAAPAKTAKAAAPKAAPAKSAAPKAAKSTTTAKVAAGAATGVASLAGVGEKTKKAASAAVDLGKDAVAGAASLAGDAVSGAADAASAVASGAKDAAGAAGAAVTGAATAAAAGVSGLASSAGGAAHKLTGTGDGKPGNSRWMWYLLAAVLILAFLWWLFSSHNQPSADVEPMSAASSETMDASTAAADPTSAAT